MSIRTFLHCAKNLKKSVCLDIEQLQGKVNELLHENKLLQTQYDERKIHIQSVLRLFFRSIDRHRVFSRFRYLESKLHQSDTSLTSVLNENTSLKQRLQSYEQSEQTIRELMNKYANNAHHEELFKTINRTLAIYEQRLGYINKRFLVLQTLFNRQLLSLSSKQHTTVAIQTEDEQYFDLSLLERELQNVSYERDLLLHKLDQEYEQSKKRTELLEEKYKQDLLVANEKLSLMQMMIEESQLKVELYERNLMEKEQQLKELTEKWTHEQQKRTENVDLIKQDFQVDSFDCLSFSFLQRLTLV